MSSGNSVFQGRKTFPYVSDVCTLIVIIYMLMERMELECQRWLTLKMYNLCVTSKTRIFLENKPLLIASQESLASEKSQVNDDLLPFSTEDEIDSPFFNS